MTCMWCCMDVVLYGGWIAWMWYLLHMCLTTVHSNQICGLYHLLYCNNIKKYILRNGLARGHMYYSVELLTNGNGVSKNGHNCLTLTSICCAVNRK